VGLGILEDLKKLEDDYGMEFKKYHDIGVAAKRTDPVFFDSR
jgi:hypothetical protein